MRKFIVILCSVALMAGTVAPVSVGAATVSDAYDFNGDIQENPWEEIFKPEEPEVPLAIVTQPSDVTVKSGTKTEFVVEATGLELTYQWQYCAKGKDTWTSLSGAAAKKSSYTVTASAAFNGYKYRCVITDANGESITSEAAMVIISDVLSIITHPTEVTMNDGESNVFEVVASGEGLTYQWQYSPTGRNTWYNLSGSASRRSTYKVKVNASFHGYRYRCVVTDANGDTVSSNPAMVYVLADIVIKTQPTNITVAVGDRAVVSMDAYGVGIKFQWQYCAKGKDTWTDLKGVTARRNAYGFNATAAFDGFKYRCIVTDAWGETVITDEVTVTVTK